MPISANYQLPLTEPNPGHSPLDVDLMDATFYLGQDIGPNTVETPLVGSHGLVDFYEKYWDNLMLLGGFQTTTGVAVSQDKT